MPKSFKPTLEERGGRALRLHRRNRRTCQVWSQGGASRFLGMESVMLGVRCTGVEVINYLKSSARRNVDVEKVLERTLANVIARIIKMDDRGEERQTNRHR